MMELSIYDVRPPQPVNEVDRSNQGTICIRRLNPFYLWEGRISFWNRGTADAYWYLHPIGNRNLGGGKSEQVAAPFKLRLNGVEIPENSGILVKPGERFGFTVEEGNLTPLKGEPVPPIVAFPAIPDYSRGLLGHWGHANAGNVSRSYLPFG